MTGSLYTLSDEASDATGADVTINGSDACVVDSGGDATAHASTSA